MQHKHRIAIVLAIVVAAVMLPVTALGVWGALTRFGVGRRDSDS